jgi:hypothetical protein
MWNDFPNFLRCTFYIFASSLLANSYILRSVRWPPTVPRTVSHARDHWGTLDLANAFVSPGVNSRAELQPSLRAVGSGMSCIVIPSSFQTMFSILCFLLRTFRFSILPKIFHRHWVFSNAPYFTEGKIQENSRDLFIWIASSEFPSHGFAHLEESL